MPTEGTMYAHVVKVWMLPAVMSPADADPTMPAATATNPTMPFENAPAILSSIGRTLSVTASLRRPVLSCPYSIESVIVRIAVIWIVCAGR